MSGDPASFRLLCADPRNAAIKARWHEIAERCIERAASKGITVTAEQLVELPCLRIEAISGQVVDDWEAQAKIKLPQWRALAETEAAYAALQDESSPDHAASAERFAAMSPSERMRVARQAGHSLPKPNEPKKELSAAEKVRLSEKLNSMDVSPSMRIKLAREWGIS